MHAERTDPAGVNWAGRTFGELNPEEQAKVTAWAASSLQDELRENADAFVDALERPVDEDDRS